MKDGVAATFDVAATRLDGRGRWVHARLDAIREPVRRRGIGRGAWGGCLRRPRCGPVHCVVSACGHPTRDAPGPIRSGDFEGRGRCTNANCWGTGVIAVGPEWILPRCVLSPPLQLEHKIQRFENQRPLSRYTIAAIRRPGRRTLRRDSRLSTCTRSSPQSFRIQGFQGVSTAVTSKTMGLGRAPFRHDFGNDSLHQSPRSCLPDRRFRVSRVRSVDPPLNDRQTQEPSPEEGMIPAPASANLSDRTATTRPTAAKAQNTVM